MTDERRIVLTDPPDPVDPRCPQCGAGRELRERSRTYGRPHDVCRRCGFDFPELTVPAEVPPRLLTEE